MAEKSKAYYGEELALIEKCSEDEMKELIPLVVSGDRNAENRMIEGNLYRVYEAAGYFATEKISFMDLVQEGNIALVLLLRGLKNSKNPVRGLSRRMDIAIKDAMESFVSEEEESLRAAEEMKVRLNVMDEVCTRLAEEYGREATAEEVAEKMDMEPDSVRYLMRVALAALSKETGEEEE